MKDWLPQLEQGDGPLHRRLVDRLEHDIAIGTLPAGTRLPPQRILADRIGLSVGTVTKAYAEAERRGLVQGQVGRGTFVAAPPENGAIGATIDLSLNVIPHHEAARRLPDTLVRLGRRPGPVDLLAYGPAVGHDAHRQAAARWVENTSGFAPDGERLVLTSGAQHAIALAFAACCRPGDRILCEEVSFYGMKSLAAEAGYTLVPVAMDEEGLVPAALDRAARAGAQALYAMPTVQNPTGRTMGNARREEIAGIARQHDLRIVEDDLYAIFTPPARPRLRRLAEMAPERTFHVAGVSKALAPGLRVGCLVCPDAAAVAAVTAAMRAAVYAPPALGPAVLAAWMSDGSAEAIVAAQRSEIGFRFERARELLGEWMESAVTLAPHIWIAMPEIEAERLTNRALRAGVLVTPPAALAIPGGSASGVRLCIGAPASRTELAHALGIVRDALTGDATPATAALV